MNIKSMGPVGITVRSGKEAEEGVAFYSKPNPEKTKTGEILWVF